MLEQDDATESQNWKEETNQLDGNHLEVEEEKEVTKNSEKDIDFALMMNEFIADDEVSSIISSNVNMNEDNKNELISDNNNSKCSFENNAITHKKDYVTQAPSSEQQVPEQKITSIATLPTTIKPAPSSAKRKGVAFDSDEDESEAIKIDSSSKSLRLGRSSSLNSESSEEKYERIRSESKKKLEESGWIDVRSMKSKVKKNSLFKR